MAVKKVTSQLRPKGLSSWPGRTVFAAGVDRRTRDTREAVVAVAGDDDTHSFTWSCLPVSLVFRRRGMTGIGQDAERRNYSRALAIRC